MEETSKNKNQEKPKASKEKAGLKEQDPSAIMPETDDKPKPRKESAKNSK